MGFCQDLRSPVMVSARSCRDMRSWPQVRRYNAVLSRWLMVADIWSLTVAGLAHCLPHYCASNMVEDSSDAITLSLIVLVCFPVCIRSRAHPLTLRHCVQMSWCSNARKMTPFSFAFGNTHLVQKKQCLGIWIMKGDCGWKCAGPLHANMSFDSYRPTALYLAW